MKIKVIKVIKARITLSENEISNLRDLLRNQSDNDIISYGCDIKIINKVTGKLETLLTELSKK